MIISFLLVLLILTNLMLSGAERTDTRIRLLMAQGAVLCLLPLLIRAPGFGFHNLLLVALTAGLKIYLLPKLLQRIEPQSVLPIESPPRLRFSASILFGVISLACAMWLGVFAINFPGVTSTLIVPTALSTMFIGLGLMISGRQMLSQLMGYLVLGNGVFIFGVVLAQTNPLLIELGVVVETLVVALVICIERSEAPGC